MTKEEIDIKDKGLKKILEQKNILKKSCENEDFREGYKCGLKAEREETNKKVEKAIIKVREFCGPDGHGALEDLRKELGLI